MVRQINPAALAELAKDFGTEPVNIVEIQWVDQGNFIQYADKTVELLNLSGLILEISNLESVIKLDSEGRSESISLKLSDHKNDLKQIIDNNDIHARPCRVYQWFPVLPLDEKFLLYEGELTSNIIWDEGDRTLSLEVITRLADKEAGFSPEEGDFNFIPDKLIGVPWPLCFGTVQNVPGIQLQEVPNTSTAIATGVVDPSLEPRIEELKDIIQQLKQFLQFLLLALLQAEFTCDFGNPNDSNTQQACGIAQQLQQQVDQLFIVIAQAEAELENLEEVLEQQQAEQQDVIETLDGSNFPQNQVVVLDIGGSEYTGTFQGNNFIVSAVVLPNFIGILDEPFGFTFHQAGTNVRILTESQVDYIVNLLPSTVHHVQAFRTVEGNKFLVTIDSSFYTVKTVDLIGYTVTVIEFKKPLSTIDPTLEDSIYVTLTSPVGPNTVDILEFLIETYTDLAIDANSFNSVKTKLDNYPSHFALLERKNILQLLEEIAFQARCSIWISQGTFYIKYLSEELTEDDTITEDDIEAGTLKLLTTNTEDIVTKFIAEWTDDYAQEEKNRIILRHNVIKYGTRERVFDFYIYNLPILVAKSATFWLIRFSNVWKKIKFETYLNKLNLETFDIVKFIFAQNFVANQDVKGIIESAVYNSDKKTIDMEIWLPVKLGTMIPYKFVWPKDIDPNELFPTEEEIRLKFAGGAGPGEEVIGDFTITNELVQSIRNQQFNSGQRFNRRDYGDLRPSDLDDIKPTPNFVGLSAPPKTEPKFDYQYGDHSFTPTLEEKDEKINVYPGQIINQAGTQTNLYNVNIFKKGLLSAPTQVQVKQLQIDTTQVIPTGTWVIVVENKEAIDSNNNNAIITEYVMQVPVWL